MQLNLIKDELERFWFDLKVIKSFLESSYDLLIYHDRVCAGLKNFVVNCMDEHHPTFSGFIGEAEAICN